MGTITVLDQTMRAVDKAIQPSNLLDQVKRTERRTFPRDEAMDFDLELKKRNTELIVVLEEQESTEDHENNLAGYLVYARLHGIALLHKVCVLEGHQRQGIAHRMLSRLKDKLQGQGCERLQLWVDEARMPSRALYESMGFKISDRARDYYGPGRTGIKMAESIVRSDAAANLAMKPSLHRPAARCSLIRTLFGTLLLFAGSTSAAPGIAFPINSQVPSVARVSKPYQFVFSGSTFASSLQELSYALSSAPQWLNLDSSARMFYGTPGPKDVGVASFDLVATDATGATYLPVTLVVSSDAGPGLGKPVTQQLPAFGTFSSPDSLLIYPSSPFLVSFGAGTFTNTNRSTVYYASCGNNTPLPSWITFEASTLTFSGTTPSFTSPLELPQQFPIQLTASDVAGFSGAIAYFQLIIASHELTFSNQTAAIEITPGKPVKFSLTQLELAMDGRPTNYSDLTGITANTPTWLSLDTHSLILSGTVPMNAVSQSFSISVADRYGDTASTTLLLSVGPSPNLILGSVGTIQATIGSNFAYKFKDSLFSTSRLHVSISLGNTSTWLRFDEATLSLYGEVPEVLEPQVDHLTVTATNGSQSESQNFMIALSLSGISSSPSSSSTGTGLAASESASSPSAGSTMQPATEGVAGTQQRGKIIAGAVVGSSIGSFAVLFLLCFIWRKRQKRNREGYLGAFRRQISGPRLQKPDTWDKETEVTEKFVAGHRRVPSKVPQVDIAKRHSRFSDMFPFFPSSETGRPKSRGLPDLLTMDEERVPLRPDDAYLGPHESRYMAKRASRALPLTTSSSAFFSRQFSTRSLTDRSSRRLSSLGHGGGVNRTLSRSRSGQFKRFSRSSTSYGFGHGKNASFDRLSPPPPLFDRAKAPRPPTTTSSDHMSAECPSPSIYSPAQQYNFPRPCTVYADAIPEDSFGSTNFSRPTTRATIRAVPKHRVSRTPTPTRNYMHYLKTRRSHGESALFAAGASSRKSSVAKKTHVGMSTHAESSSEEHPKGSSSNSDDTSSDKENKTHNRTSDPRSFYHYDEQYCSPAYRKGVMMQQPLSSTSSQSLAPPPLSTKYLLPSPLSRAHPTLKRSKRSISPLKLAASTSRFQGFLRGKSSKSSFGSEMRLEGMGSDVGEDLMLEVGEGGRAETSRSRPGAGGGRDESERVGLERSRPGTATTTDTDEERKVWAHTQHPNPLGVHGAGAERGLLWSKTRAAEESGSGSGSGNEGGRGRSAGGHGGDGSGAGEGSGREREEGRDFSGVGAFL
ncbi:hypothetical protein MMC30_000666 [Trapelia coarctata]|nr:hypothetical protein [Trapelia coarctata]